MEGLKRMEKFKVEKTREINYDSCPPEFVYFFTVKSYVKYFWFFKRWVTVGLYTNYKDATNKFHELITNYKNG